MLTIQTHQVELTGSNYEIGYQLGKMMAEIPPLKARHTEGMAGFGLARPAEAADLFDSWCPGLTQELSGFADALEVRTWLLNTKEEMDCREDFEMYDERFLGYDHPVR